MNQTEKYDARTDLRWNARRFNQLIEKVRDFAIFICDPNGLIETWNLGGELIFGYSPEEIIGQHTSILFTPEDRRQNVPQKEMITAAETGRAEDERWHIRKDGTRFYASGIQTPIYENERLTGFAKIARDLTERVLLENALREERDNLEAKVRERTRELNDSVELLRQENIERVKAEETRSKLLRRIITTQEDERKRIARDIHDHLGQQMTGLKLTVETLKDKADKGLNLTLQVEKVQSIVKRLDSEIDFLAWELRPTVLDDLGLIKALEIYVNEWSRHFSIAAECQSLGIAGERFEPEIEINLYRIVQEALNNTAKHSGADHAGVLIKRLDGHLVVIIEDDGKGFDLAEKADISQEDRGMGLLGMRERAMLINGSTEIESAQGKGTAIYVRVPLELKTESVN